MPLLIDTYNVLHTVGILPPDLAGVDLQGLINLLAASRHRQQAITLACDGTPKTADARKPDLRGMTITIRYSGAGKPADDLISQIIHASTAPRRLTVVSSDHAVLRAARRRRCPTLTSEEFLQQLVDDAHLPQSTDTKSTSNKPLPGTMTDAQVDRWINVFKLDQETVAIPAGGKIEPPQGDASAAPNADSSPATDVDLETVADHVIQELPPGNEIPADLIEQAERLWSQQNHPMVKPKSLTQSESIKADDSDEHETIDMNALLPDDGKTRRTKQPKARP